MLTPILDGRADVVYGSRFIGGESHRVLYFWHSIANRFLTLFSNMMTDYELCSLISSGPIDETADLLLATALARGAGDNVTFVLVESIGDSGTQRDEY